MSILELSAYVYATMDIFPDVKEKVSQIEQLDGWRIFIGDHWPAILSAMKEMYNQGKEYSLDPIDRMADEMDKILRRCGLELRDATNGFYVEVHDPSYPSEH